MTDGPVLNAHNKAEYPPMHTAEHILNRTMVDMFGCERSKNAHIERKKSKCDYHLAAAPTPAQIEAIERRVNDVIASCADVTVSYVPRDAVPSDVDLSKLPEDASELLRLVRVGDYDVCACIGTHVSNTREIAPFKIISSDYKDGVWRVRFKLLEG
ncbi:MAG: hypothetical protein IKY83_13155 [Proteobacteria bacterium]|nr:hypothetical protein [Pseudomonadota bacterium]